MTSKVKFRLRPFLPLLNLLAAMTLLMGAAFADGRPSVFYDSDSYDLAGRNFLELIQKAPDSLTFRMRPGLDIGDDPVTSDDDLDPQMMGARSAWYGLVLRGLWVVGGVILPVGGLWLLAGVQAFVVAWVLRLIWRAVAPGAPAWSYLGLVGGLTLGSTLPFFTTFAMPDVFTGVIGAAVVVFMMLPQRIGWIEQAALWVLLVMFMSFHGSNPILAGPLVGVAVVAGLWLRAPVKATLVRGALVLLAAAIGLLAVRAYGLAFERRSGRELHHPPFVAARLLVDGPAHRFLLQKCTDDVTPFVLCRYRFQPMEDTDVTLWSDEPELGVFNVAPSDTRIKMEHEETAFALAVIAYDPLGQVLASTRDWLEQLGMFWVEDPIRNPQVFLRDPYWGNTTLRNLIPNARECRPWGPGCAPPFYMESLGVWHGLILILSLGWMGWRLTRRDVREALKRPNWERPIVRLVAATLVMIAAVLINAAICGALSGTFTRYQARVVWLVPLAAGLVATVLVPHAAIAWVRAWLARRQGAIIAWGARQRLPAWAQPIAARVLGHPLARKVNPQMLRFGVVGVIGFVVHAALLELFTGVAYLNTTLGWVIAFALATTTTWTINRAWTFRDHANDERRAEEASTYVAVQSFAAMINFAVYLTLKSFVPFFGAGLGLLPPLAAGAIAGMFINYLGSRHLVFRHRPQAAAAE